MASTPRRNPPRKSRGSVSPAPKGSPGPCPFKGMELVVPGHVFHVPDTVYKAIVKGWNDRSTDSVVVRFDDGSQYWFPVEDVSDWINNPQATADSAAPDTGGSQSSPASGQKVYNLRKRHHTPTTVTKSRRTPAADNAVAPGSSTKKPTSRPIRHQQAQQQEQAPEQQARDGVPRLPSLSVAGIMAGVVLLLIVMLGAITASRGAAHDLEGVLDSLNELYNGVGARFSTRNH